MHLQYLDIVALILIRNIDILLRGIRFLKGLVIVYSRALRRTTVLSATARLLRARRLLLAIGPAEVHVQDARLEGLLQVLK